MTILGTPSHVNGRYNKTHTYDNFGIVLFEKINSKVASGTISEMQFYFGETERNAVVPSGFCGGNLKIEKINLLRYLSSDDLIRKLKTAGYIQRDSYMEHNFRLAKKGIYIYFLFSENEQTLLKVSLGKDSDTVSEF